MTLVAPHVVSALGISLIRPCRIRRHERIDPEYARELAERIRAEEKVLRPLFIDQSSGTLLDGHHRFNALSELLKIDFVPAVVVDYQDPDLVAVGSWRTGETVTKASVLAAAASGVLMPMKTSRHRFHFTVPEQPTPLIRLYEEPQ